MKKIPLYLLLFFASYSLLSQNSKEVSRHWTFFFQRIEIESNTTKKFKVIASVKIETEDPNAKASLWARVDNNDGEMGFFDNMDDRPITSNQWQSYEIEGLIDSKSERLNFGGLCYYNAKFYFDKFELHIENDKGVFEKVEIDNPSFEDTISDKNEIPKWVTGKIKGFSISSSSDSVDGNRAMMFEGENIEYVAPTYSTIDKVEGASPQIGSMISMLENLKSRVERAVSKLSQYELDHLHDEEANRIGALIMHLAAAEKLYQVITFEGRRFNKEEKEIWNDALRLDEGGRDKFKGHDVTYYLDIYNDVRKVTIEELKKRDDKWFEEIQPGFRMSNHYSWFHVMEHQSSHLGQILFLKKRIPPEPEIKLPEQLKN